MKSHLYNNAIRLGAAYNINEHLSAYVGLRINNLSWKYEINPTVNVYKNSAGTEVSLADYISDAKKGLTGSDDEKELYTNLLDNTEKLLNLEIGSNQSQSGWGVAPVIGLDYNAGDFNVGAKYDFGTHINIGEGKCIGIPSHMSLGASWNATNRFKLAVGGDVYFKSACNPMIDLDDEVLWNASVSATLKLSKSFEANVGYQVGKKTVTNEDHDYMSKSISYDGSYPSIVSAGLRYNIYKGLSADIGMSVVPTLTTHQRILTLYDTGLCEIDYKKTPIRVAVGLNYSF